MRPIFSEALQVIRSGVPTHAELEAAINAVHSAALSFHEHAGFDGSGAVVDGLEDAQKSLDFCFHYTTSRQAA